MMSQVNAQKLESLRRMLLPLQGLSHKPGRSVMQMYWGLMTDCFPQRRFPVGAIHELISAGDADAAATAGFIASIAGSLLKEGGAMIWISKRKDVFPASLASFGIAPHQVVFIQLEKEKELLWATEETLKCAGVGAVIAELPSLNFMQSRRLQLAVEQSAVTGFIFRRNPQHLQTTACVSRWKVSAAKTFSGELPGLGFPRWKIDLLKMRGGKTGSWTMEWRDARLQHTEQQPARPAIHLLPNRKVV